MKAIIEFIKKMFKSEWQLIKHDTVPELPRRFPGYKNPPPPPISRTRDDMEYRIKEFAGMYSVQGKFKHEPIFRDLDINFWPYEWVGSIFTTPKLKPFDDIYKAADLVKKLKKGIVYHDVLT